MQKRSFNVSFSKKCGKIKAMHGTNLSFEHGTLGKNPIDDILSRHAPAVVGLHDIEYPYGQNQYVDIHCIFPDMSGDSEKEESYNFKPTDEYLEKIRESGADIIFRLGESTDKYAVKPFLKPRISVEKFADICLHIVMHYNARWAQGYKWNIKYFEIWSGADSADGYGENLDDYVRLYTAVSKRIREVFPKIKLGGYSSLGFGSMNRGGGSEEEKRAYSFAEGFLREIAKLEAPLDFFTWRCRVSGAEELSLHTKYAKALIGSSGYRTAKSIISEFEINRDATAAEYLAAMIVADKSEVEMMLYRHSVRNEEKEIADLLYSVLYGAGKRVYVSDDYRRELYLSAAQGEGFGVIAVGSTGFSGTVEILFGECEYDCFDITEISKKEDGSYVKAGLSNVLIKQKRIAFSAKPNSVYMIKMK